MLAEVGIKCYSIPMINRKDQIHAALYNAAIDAGFMLYAGHRTGVKLETKIMVKDLTTGEQKTLSIEELIEKLR